MRSKYAATNLFIECCKAVTLKSTLSLIRTLQPTYLKYFIFIVPKPFYLSESLLFFNL